MAGWFRYPLVTRIADKLIQFLEVIAAPDKDAIEIVLAFHMTLRAVLMGRVTGSGGKHGEELCRRSKPPACAISSIIPRTAPVMVERRRKNNCQGSAASLGEEPKIGDAVPDGTIYAGLSPETGKAMYTTPRDAGRTLTWKRAMAFAARLDAHGHCDWRVPTKAELNVLFQNRGAIGGFETSGRNANGWYWSSSKDVDDTAWGQDFSDGLQISYGKILGSSLRCVRPAYAGAKPRLRAGRG